MSEDHQLDAPLLGEIQITSSVPCHSCGFDRAYFDPFSTPSPRPARSWLRSLFERRPAPLRERYCDECGAR